MQIDNATPAKTKSSIIRLNLADCEAIVVETPKGSGKVRLATRNGEGRSLDRKGERGDRTEPVGDNESKSIHNIFLVSNWLMFRRLSPAARGSVLWAEAAFSLTLNQFL